MKKTNDLKRNIEVTMKATIEKPEDHIVFKVINTEKNKDILKKAPHRKFLDLSVIYALTNESGQFLKMVTDQIAKTHGWSEEQLFQMAMRNTKSLFPFKVMRMCAFLFENSMELFGVLPYEDDIYEPGPDDEEMWVLTNEQKVNGCNVLLYEELFHKLAERLSSDLYLLPSSRHEIIAVSSKVAEWAPLSSIVPEVNKEAVDEEDFLSDSVYRYDRISRDFSVVEE
jgi:hypothetical protein